MRKYEWTRIERLVKVLKYVAINGRLQSKWGTSRTMTSSDVRDLALDAATTISELVEENEKIRILFMKKEDERDEEIWD